MSLKRFIGGTVYDPANGIDGLAMDLWALNGRMIAAPDAGVVADIEYDLQSRVVMPGGVDMHAHVCGPGVNAARLMQIGMKPQPNTPMHVLKRRGPQHLCPPVGATGELYTGLGYTTLIDAAIPPSSARSAHLEMNMIPGPDKGFLTLAGNHPYGLELLSRGEHRCFDAFCGWLMHATKAFGLKVVNPGGVANWSNGKDGLLGIDDLVDGFGITPRTILLNIARAADTMRLPHAMHVHCNRLALPGGWEAMLQSMQALEGFRGHFTHVQFHSYGGTASDPSSICSEVAKLVAYVNANRNITVDVGQVLFGDAMSLTGDLAAAEYLAKLLRTKRVIMHSGCDGGCGVMPLCYKDTSFVHSLQWAIGLEWYLLVTDPWRLAMSTDHPNGGSFLSYPEIIALLMSNNYRHEVLKKLPPKVREHCSLPDITPEYTLGEIAIVTRASPARMLGLKDKGHLGPGAAADMTVYNPADDKRAMFALPHLVFKDGVLIFDKGELRSPSCAPNFHFEPAFDSQALPGLDDWIRDSLCIEPANFPVTADQLPTGALRAVC